MKNINKLKAIIPASFKKKLLFLFVLLIFGMIFEMIGIGLLLPVLTAILEPNLITGNEQYREALLYYNIDDSREITFYLMGIVITIYILKSAFLLWSNKKQNRLNANLVKTISNILYHNYLNQNYLFHVNKNSSEIIKLLQIEINHFNTYLIAFIYFVTELSLVVAVLASLLIIEPVGILSILSVFFIFSSVFYQYSKKLSLKWGNLRETKDKEMSKLLFETFGGIKEVIKTNSFEYFSNSYKNINRVKATVSAKNLTLAQVPRYFLEIITVVALVVFILINITQAKEVESIIVILGILVAAILRVLPSINRILTSLQQMKYYQSSLTTLYDELSKTKDFSFYNKEFKSTPFKTSFDLEGISFTYPQKKLKVLDNISLKVEKGSFIGILGESGSGKSTLINIIAGLIEPDSGQLKVDDIEISKLNKHNWRENIGYVSQSTYLIDGSILENVAFGVEQQNISETKVKKALKDASLINFMNTLPEGLNTRIGERGIQFSGGQQQRLGIARALYKSPELLILDEATSALDRQTERKIMKSIHEISKKITIIMISHRPAILKNCTSIYSLNNGHLMLSNDEK